MNEQQPVVRYAVVRSCADVLIAYARTGDLDRCSAVELLRRRVPDASRHEMILAVAIALECHLPCDEGDFERVTIVYH